MASVDHAGAGSGARAQPVLRRVAGYLPALSALLVRVGAAGVAYVAQVLIGRLLGETAYGTYALAWTLLGILGFLASLGIGHAALRFVPYYQERNETALARGFVSEAAFHVLVAGLMVAGLGLLFAPVFVAAYGETARVPIMLALIAVPAFAYGDLQEGLARSQGWTLRALAPPYLLRHMLMVGAIALLSATGCAPQAETAMAAGLVAVVLAAAAQTALVGPRLAGRLGPGRLESDLSVWAATARTALGADAANLIRQSLDVLLLAMLCPPDVVGLYFAASRIAAPVGLVEFAVAASEGHRFARAFAREGCARALRPLIRRAAMLTFGGALAGGAFIVALAPWLLGLFGAGFVAAAPVVAILVLGQVLRALAGPAEAALMACGRGQDAMRAHLLGAAATAAGLLMLAPVYGAKGAAFGVALGLAASAGSLALSQWRMLAEEPPAA